MEGRQRFFRGFWCDRNKQTAGSLRIEKQILKFERDTFRKRNAITNERAIIFQAA